MYDNRLMYTVFFKPWDNPEKIHWYCEDHYNQAKSFDEKEKLAFLEYYSDSRKREWLPEKHLKLYYQYAKK
ncbi:hypothetical protein [Niallia taxi]|uniref:hypothetical protein n=1 Tax=Niallia taxi TaxID=2499688 RepID=UPI002E1FEF2F|nr:hypothetical protein [Niallia taxi]